MSCRSCCEEKTRHSGTRRSLQILRNKINYRVGKYSRREKGSRRAGEEKGKEKYLSASTWAGLLHGTKVGITWRSHEGKQDVAYPARMYGMEVSWLWLQLIGKKSSPRTVVREIGMSQCSGQ